MAHFCAAPNHHQRISKEHLPLAIKLVQHACYRKACEAHSFCLMHISCDVQGGQITISPSVKEAHSVMALFQLPSLTNQYRSKAEDYLSHLVGHEGQGSLLSALKARGWASELGAGVGDSGYDRNTAAFVFEVHITLTDAGLAAEQGMQCRLPCKMSTAQAQQSVRNQAVCI